MKLLVDDRVTGAHLGRPAVVYIRQSTPDQVRNHTESTRLQIAARERAIALGWSEPVLLDGDLGISATGFAVRPEFDQLLHDVTLRRVGIIFCAEAARLSRNSPQWAELFQMCGAFDTLIVDGEQIYDLRRPNDRLVLGIRGTVAELEISIMQRRMTDGREAKAARGELRFLLSPGYTHDLDGRIVKDPDQRVQHAMNALFERFDQSTSVRQLVLAYQEAKTLFPVRNVHKHGTTVWELPTLSTFHKILAHPIYAGTYVYGRRTTRIECEDGHLVKRISEPCDLDAARVCIHDHHDAYISLERFQANQAKIANARPRFAMQQNTGAIRDGAALLSGLLRCKRCGRLLYVQYHGEHALYHCRGHQGTGNERCLSFGSKLIDDRISHELCRALAPLAVQAARAAFERRRRDNSARIEAAALDLKAAQYDADRAFEQFDLADPKRRLVVDTLEQRLNDRLVIKEAAQKRLDGERDTIRPLTEQDQAALTELGTQFPMVWDDPSASIALKKQLLRAAIHEIIVDVIRDDTHVEAIIHWQGGVHTRIELQKRKTPVGSKTDPELTELLGMLAATLDDTAIARVLNMKKITTPTGLVWTKDRVMNFRRQHHITLGNAPPDPDVLTGAQAAEHLGISRNGVIGLIREGYIENRQAIEFAPWLISKAQLDAEPVLAAAHALKATGRVPPRPGCSTQQESLLPIISRTI